MTSAEKLCLLLAAQVLDRHKYPRSLADTLRKIADRPARHVFEEPERPADLSFDAALDAIRAGGDYTLHGLTLVVNGVAMAITDEQVDLAYDVIDEVDGDDSVVSVNVHKRGARDPFVGTIPPLAGDVTRHVFEEHTGR